MMHDWYLGIKIILDPYLLRGCVVGGQEAAHAAAGGLGAGVCGGCCSVEVTRAAHVAGAKHPIRVSG